MRLILTAFLFVFCFSSVAQLETSNWLLYRNNYKITPSGVTTGFAVPDEIDYAPELRCTSVSDEKGNLLFAFDGKKIIDRNLKPMPAFQSLSLASEDGKPMAIQIPNSTKYLLFYIRSNVFGPNQPSTLRYATIDMSLNNGNGDLVDYDHVIDDRLSKSFTIVRGNDPDAWLVTHRIGTDSFYSYKLDANGINITPVKSRAGSAQSKDNYNFWDLKASFDGRMVAGMAYKDYTTAFATVYSFIEVFDFDALTGKLSERVRSLRRFGYFQSYLSLEFSPDNRLLYLSSVSRIGGLQPCGFGLSRLQQYNLCYTDSVEFDRFSMITGNAFYFCYPNSTWGLVQMGADKRLHMPLSGTMVTTTEFPNRIGSRSDFKMNSYSLPNGNNQNPQAPAFYHKLMEKAVKNNIVFTGGCFPSPLSFYVTNDTLSSISWNFGDPSGSGNTVTALKPDHRFSKPGSYTVTAKIYDSKGRLIETLQELVEIKDPQKRILNQYPKDTLLCQDESLWLGVSVTNGIYHWYQKWEDGTEYNHWVADTIRIYHEGKYYVEMRQNDCDGCRMLDSINVRIAPKPYVLLGGDQTLCIGDSIQLGYNEENVDYVWNTGSRNGEIWVKKGGKYWVTAEIDKNGCKATDTVIIREAPGVKFKFPNDTILCNNQTLDLKPGIANAYYFWQDGSDNENFRITAPGSYWVKVTNDEGCSHADTIKVSYITAAGVNLGKDTLLCAGQTLRLNPGIPDANYLWSTGAKTETITINKSGDYWVEVNNKSCVITDTIKVIFTTPPSQILPNDTTICIGEKLTLRPTLNVSVLQWQDGSTKGEFFVNPAGKYWLKARIGGCIVTDTIHVSLKEAVAINLGPDVRFCANDSTILNTGNSFEEIIWSNGFAGNSITVKTPGMYSVIGKSFNGCKSYDTINVLNPYPLPVVNLTKDSILCKGESRILNAGSGFTNYQWNTGAQTAQLTVTDQGFYEVTVKDINGCTNSDHMTITSVKNPPSDFLPRDTAVCSYGNIDLRASQSFRSYTWNTGASGSQINVSLPGLYVLTAKDQFGCTGTDSVLVRKKDCLLGFYMPTAFTPNGDGKNDILKPLIFGNVEFYEFTVYNRFGTKIFETKDLNKGWDGFVKGLEQGTHVFVWSCRYKLAGEDMQLKKGTVTLIR